MIPLRFSAEDADQAHADWGANCGPGALAAVLGLTLEEVRPHLQGFDDKRYTNPTMMWAALRSLGIGYRLRRPPDTWPDYGLVRVQWEGPWTAPRVPPRVAYRHTHWVGAQRSTGRPDAGIFDINCMTSGGWVSEHDWSKTIVPWLLDACVPRASGGWHLTHVVEIDRTQLERRQ